MLEVNKPISVQNYMTDITFFVQT